MIGHREESDVLSDHCDGKNYMNHSHFSSDHTTLQNLLYYDELELCNSLGSKRKKKHKIG